MQFKKREKHPWRNVTFSKSDNPQLVFSRFLNCTNGTKLRKASHLLKKNNGDGSICPAGTLWVNTCSKSNVDFEQVFPCKVVQSIHCFCFDVFFFKL